MKLSILSIFCRERRETLVNFLTSLFSGAGKIPFEIILVNNGGEDIGDLNKTFKNLTIIQNEKNAGVAKARNQAAAKSSGEIILFIDSDSVVKNRAIEEMYDYLVNHSQIGAIAPAIFSQGGVLSHNFGPLPSWKYPFTEIFNLSGKVKLTPKAGLTEFLAGSAVMIKREVWEKVGCFDENFFYGREDADWSKRAKEKGIKLFYFPKVKILHLLHQSAYLTGARQIDFYVSEVYYSKKHFGIVFARFLKIFLIVFSLIRIGISFLKTGRGKTRRQCWQLIVRLLSISY